VNTPAIVLVLNQQGHIKGILVTQASFAVYKYFRFSFMLLFLAMLSFSSLLHANDETPVKPVTVPNPATDLWRAIREGQTGFVANPGRNSARLVVGIPRKDCSKTGNCTEQALGFSLPIHMRVPDIREKQGVGGEISSISFVLVIIAGLMLAGVVFTVKLTKGKSDDVTTEGGGTK